MKKVPVIVFQNKENKDRYLASSMDVGDWEDENLDITIDEIENAFMIWHANLQKLDMDEAIQEQIKHSRAYKKAMIDKFGENAIVTYDVEGWLEMYDPVHFEITIEQFEHARNLAFS